MQKNKSSMLIEQINLDSPDNPNYNSSQGLNYFAVAHVGILVLADWVFKNHIANNSVLLGTWQWIMKQAPSNLLLSSKSTLVDVVNLLWNVGSNAIKDVKDAATKFVNGIKDGLKYISNAVIDAIFTALGTGLNGFSFAIGKIIQTLFSGFSVSSSDFTYFTDNGHTYPLGILKSGNNLIMESGFFNLTLDGLFGGQYQPKLNGVAINGNSNSGWDTNTVNFGSVPKSSFLQLIAWKYFMMELLKEILLTASFTIWQALLVLQKQVTATAVYMLELLASDIGSISIFNLLKNDASLTKVEKEATIYQIYNLHLNFVAGDLVDVGINLFQKIFHKEPNNEPNNVVSFAASYGLSNLISFVVGKPFFDLLNPNNNDLFSLSNLDKGIEGVIGFFLNLAGGFQLKYAVEPSVKDIAILAKLLQYLPKIFSFEDFNNMYTVVLPILSSYLASSGTDLINNLPTFQMNDFNKAIFGTMLWVYQIGETIMWAKMANSL